MNANPRVPKRVAPDSVWADHSAHREPGRVDVTQPDLRRLYGPKGEVLLTVSDRPPVGFHQGARP